MIEIVIVIVIIIVIVIVIETDLQTETVLCFIVQTPVRVETPGPVSGVLMADCKNILKYFPRIYLDGIVRQLALKVDQDRRGYGD